MNAHTNIDKVETETVVETPAAELPPQGARRARKRGFPDARCRDPDRRGGYGGYELLSPSTEVTDDAYVAGDVVAITAREPGTILAIIADNTERVKRGQTLIEFDPASTDAALASAEADLARAVRSVRSNFSKVDETDAQIVVAQADLAKARNDLRRRQAAAAEGAVSGEEVSHAADQLRTAAAQLTLARSHQAQANASVQGTSIRSNPDVLAAIAAYRRAAISKAHMQLTAPADGVIAQRSVQLGQQVGPGTPLMAVVPLDKVWVDANFRETQLAELRVGQP